MARYFEKISLEQYMKDCFIEESSYNQIKLPTRSTKYSAGYDFFSLFDLCIKPKETLKIATGIKANMNDDEVLMLYIRSSMGFKYNVRMCNQVGIIDKDYYNNSVNEGHIWIKIQNEGEKDFIIKKDDAICQGIFTKYLIVDNEQNIEKEREGGIGSTNKEE